MRTIGPNKNNRIISESELNMSRFYFLIKTKKGHKRPRHIVRLRTQCGRHSRRGCPVPSLRSDTGHFSACCAGRKALTARRPGHVPWTVPVRRLPLLMSHRLVRRGALCKPNRGRNLPVCHPFKCVPGAATGGRVCVNLPYTHWPAQRAGCISEPNIFT